MTLFQLVKIALDELYKEAVGVYGPNTDAEIKAKFPYLTTSYNQLSLSGRVPINYKDPATRFAYVYKYVASHGDYVVKLLETLAQAQGGRIFVNDIGRVSCIGGGPGSDVIAVVKYLADSKGKETLKQLVVYLLDKEQAWADAWTELNTKLTSPTVQLHTAFQQMDVLQPDWTSQRKFLEADVFTLSYFVSEVYSLDGTGVVSQFWQRLFSEAKPGAFFNSYFDQQWQKAGLQVVDQETNIRWYPRSSEQKSELALYTAKFDAIPKVQSVLSYRILRKK
jgi:Putative SAM-dependent methyltransferase